MLSVLIRAGMLLAIIFLGYGLRRINFFDEHALPVVSKIVLNITLPCAVITNFAAIELQPSLILLFVIGFLTCGLFVFVGYLKNLRGTANEKTMDMLNYAGFNIGCFATPFISSFLGPASVVSVCMFDVGNAMWCVGITNALCISLQNGSRIRLGFLAKRLLKSISTMVYITMMVLGLLHIRLPQTVLDFAALIAPCNTVLAMFMLGLGMNLNFRREHFRWIGHAFLFRYGIAVTLAFAFYFLMPFAREIRLGLSLAVLSPISVAAAAFTHERGCDVGLAASWNTLSIFSSMLAMTSVILIAVV